MALQNPGGRKVRKIAFASRSFTSMFKKWVVENTLLSKQTRAVGCCSSNTNFSDLSNMAKNINFVKKMDFKSTDCSI